MADKMTSRGAQPPVTGGVNERILALEEERREVGQSRFLNLLLWAVLVSVVLHVSLMIYLHFIYREQPGEMVQEFQVSIATLLPDEQLTDLKDSDLQEPDVDALSSLDDLLDERQESELQADTSAAQLEISGVGATPTLGGAGSRSNVNGLGGSGAAGSFFGITTAGKRFAYIVDMSGSMEGGRMQHAKKELQRSIRALPDFAKFYVVFYNDGLAEPPDQDGWNIARTPVKQRISNWFNELLAAGGTNPRPAFRRTFGLEEQPDVIFFLTDGQITSMSAADVSSMNNRGLRTVINTIAFGDDSSQQLLKQIAVDSGGVYRFVPARGRP